MVSPGSIQDFLGGTLKLLQSCSLALKAPLRFSKTRLYDLVALQAKPARITADLTRSSKSALRSSEMPSVVMKLSFLGLLPVPTWHPDNLARTLITKVDRAFYALFINNLLRMRRNGQGVCGAKRMHQKE